MRDYFYFLSCVVVVMWVFFDCRFGVEVSTAHHCIIFNLYIVACNNFLKACTFSVLQSIHFHGYYFFQDKRAPLSFTLSKAVDFVSPWHLMKFTAVKNLSKHQNKVLSKLGAIYLLYLFIYSGLEFTITFLTHHTFGYTAMQQGKMFLVMGEYIDFVVNLVRLLGFKKKCQNNGLTYRHF